MSILTSVNGFESSFSNHITSSSKASSALFHGESLLIWRFSMLECFNSIVLALHEFILWISTSWSVLNRWMWLLKLNALLIHSWRTTLVFFPICVIVLFDVPGVISLHVRKNDWLGFPSMIVFLAILSLRQSVVVVKRVLEWILFVVLLSWFLWKFVLSHGLVKVDLVLSLLHKSVVVLLFCICIYVKCGLAPFAVFLVLRSDEFTWLIIRIISLS